MKYIFLLLVLLTACTKDTLIDSASANNISAEIISQDKKFGYDLKIKSEGNEFIIDVEDLKPWKVDFCNVHEFCVKVTGNGGCFPEKYVFREEKTENLVDSTRQTW